MTELKMKTRTGGFVIGFRVGTGGWQENLNTAIDWALKQGFGALDLVGRPPEDTKRVRETGLQVGSVDLVGWKALLSPDPGKRRQAFAAAESHIRSCATFGARNFFTIMLPEDPSLERAENFKYMVESYGAMAPVLEKTESRIVIEGWPGQGALCCTPESCRAFFTECPFACMGINYDPLHLIRMGIEPLRFLREFAPRVFHLYQIAKGLIKIKKQL